MDDHALPILAPVALLLVAGAAFRRSDRRPGPVRPRSPGGRSVVLAFTAALIIYAAVGFAFGFTDKSPQANTIGAFHDSTTDNKPHCLKWINLMTGSGQSGSSRNM